MTLPLGVTGEGNIKVMAVPTIASTAPTVAEANSGSGLDISCYLTGDGWLPSTSENSVPDPRLCSRQIFEQRGTFTDSLEVMYVYNPTVPGDDEARLTLVEGSAWRLVVRWGTDFEDNFAAGDIVDTYQVQCGVQQKMPREDNAVLKIKQKMFVTGPVRRDVVVVA